jgi:hypothetical protein
MTLPWDDNGYRVLPAAVCMEHMEKLREYSRQFMAAVEIFTRLPGMWLCCSLRESRESPALRTGASPRTFYFLEA